MVQQALSDNTWARDVGPGLTLVLLQEYLTLWTTITRETLDEEQQDSIVWAWETNSCFSTSSTYAAKFWSREVVPTAEFTWKSKAPLQCRFFAWLALKNRCWTSDHQDACPFCEQEEETINHILLDCVFAREVWTVVCRAMGKQDWIPSRAERLSEWCQDNIGMGATEMM